MDDELVIDDNKEDATGDVEMNEVQKQRRIVMPPEFLETHDIEVGDKVVIKCEENSISIKNSNDVV
jgi:bifunctional DNA-binding transcriptional regulator/antitoxin component of YhaV-PrlF toxin-antitoxin module